MDPTMNKGLGTSHSDTALINSPTRGVVRAGAPCSPVVHGRRVVLVESPKGEVARVAIVGMQQFDGVKALDAAPICLPVRNQSPPNQPPYVLVRKRRAGEENCAPEYPGAPGAGQHDCQASRRHRGAEADAAGGVAERDRNLKLTGDIIRLGSLINRVKLEAGHEALEPIIDLVNTISSGLKQMGDKTKAIESLNEPLHQLRNRILQFRLKQLVPGDVEVNDISMANVNQIPVDHSECSYFVQLVEGKNGREVEAASTTLLFNTLGVMLNTIRLPERRVPLLKDSQFVRNLKMLFEERARQLPEFRSLNI